MSEEIQKNSAPATDGVRKMDLPRWILPAILSIILLAVAIWGIEDFNQLLLYDDEFGYWTASAYLTGTDWKSVTSGIPYYSYGYGFLILTPIRLLISSPAMMYRAAIAVNGLLLVGSFYLARNVAKQLFEEVHYALIDVVCFLVMLYPSNIVFSHIAWAECTLVFLFWVFVWLSLRVIKKPTILNHGLMAVVVVGLYVVHQRTLAVAIATVMVMAWCLWADKGRRKQVIGFAVVMVALLVVHSVIKNDLIQEFYNDNSRVKVNNFGGQTEKLGNLFTLEGLAGLVQSIIGKWLYLAVGSLMMFWWSAGAFCREVKSYIGKLSGAKKNYAKQEDSIDRSVWYLWMLLAFVGNFMVAAIYMCGVGRNDMLLYGRYTEYMIGIYIIIGVFAFLNDEKWVPKIMTYIGSVIVMGLICQNILNKVATKSYQAYHSICTSLFLEKDKSAEGAVWGFVVFGIAVSMVVILLLKSDQWKRFDIVRKLAIAGVVSGLFVMTSYNMISGVMAQKQELRIDNIISLVDCIEEIDATESSVYYCSDTEDRYWSESFQFLLKERPLTVTKTTLLEFDEDAFYLVGNKFLKTEEFSQDFYCVKKSNQFALVVLKDGELAAKAGLSKGE